MSNVRDICVELLTNVEKNQAYSTVAFQNVLQKHQLDARDRGLLTELFYGTIQRKLTLDFYFKTIYRETKKMELWVLSLLRMTVYQMAYLDRVPDRAAILKPFKLRKTWTSRDCEIRQWRTSKCSTRRFRWSFFY